MKKLLVLWVLLGIVVVSGIVFWSNIESWLAILDIQAWLGTSSGLTITTQIVLTLSILSAVVTALYLTKYERTKAREEREDTLRLLWTSQKQAQEALEEGRRQLLEVQYAIHRPILVPRQPNKLIPPVIIDWDAPERCITIRNTGNGIATNIWGLLMPAEPTGPFAHQFFKILEAPLLPDEELEHVALKRGGTRFSYEDKIKDYPLCAPKSHTPKGIPCKARLIFTYSDIFGRKHASIFDLTSLGAWVEIAILPDIEYSLEEIDMLKRI